MAVKVGIIGAGRIGKLHAENLVNQVPNANVLMIADVVAESAQQTAAHLHIPHVSSDPEEVFANPDLDAVIICSSTNTHAEFIIKAAGAGKHIFCEKPIDFSLQRIDEALAAVDKAGVKLQIGFNRRFDPNHSRVRQAVASGEIGEPHILHIFSRDPAPPPIEYVKVSGGLFFDMTIHDFDMARFLIGSEVEEIYARGDVKVNPAIGEVGDIDTAVIVLKFQNGVIGTIDNSRQAVYGYDQRSEVFGSKGAVSTGNNYPNAVVISDANRVHQEKPLYFFLERYTQSFINEMRAFMDAIEKNSPVPVSGMDGRIPVVMAMAAKKSMQENRPVKLSEIK
jgi:myo-inositol 2-dehydrogenase/D-chiro-inositol 1-dehydrogenase